MNPEHTEPRFAICINNAGYPDDLKIRTIYQILPDETAAKSRYVRLIDESGEDYLYPADLFVPVEIPRDAEKAVLMAETSSQDS